MGDKSVKSRYLNVFYMIAMLLLIGGLGMQEILLIAFVVLLLFGGKKIPELMNGLGKGVRSFKEGMNGIEKDLEENPANKEQTDDK